jgi:hypothetical protein
VLNIGEPDGNLTFQDFIRDLAKTKGSDKSFELKKKYQHLLEPVDEQVDADAREVESENSSNIKSLNSEVVSGEDEETDQPVVHITGAVMALAVPRGEVVNDAAIF